MDEEVTGVSSEQATKYLTEHGFNEIPPPRNTFIKKILSKIISPITLMLVLAAGLSFYTGKTFDGGFILVLLILNLGITLWQENKADSAIQKLNKRINSMVSVMRDRKWSEIAAREIIPGDVVKLNMGNVIPADGKILQTKNASINESALTGESLPKEKKVGETVYSGAFLTTGLLIISITATGKNTYFGKTLFSVEKTRKKSLLEEDIIRISKVLSFLSLLAIIILSAIFIFQKTAWTDILTLDLTLLIAGIPISLPTVMTLIIELGVVELAKKHVIVRRLSSLEDLSNVNLLLTDKTGTLTKNSITVQSTLAYGAFAKEDTLRFAYLCSKQDEKNTINQAIIQETQTEKLITTSYQVSDFVPVDLNRKRSSAVIEHNGKKVAVTVGAPQVIVKLCHVDEKLQQAFATDVSNLAEKGFRSLAVAISPENKEIGMQLVGLLGLSDTLRDDAKNTIAFMEKNGIKVIMVTGDNHAITKEVASQLALHGEIVTKDTLEKVNWQENQKALFARVSAFAEILPNDKYTLVTHAKQYYVVASNGDGINDLPAVKAANVGFAVKNAVDALRSTADIVLLSEGIAVIKDAIIEGRKIFSRIYTYSMYRISESERLIATIVVLGILYKVYPLTPLQVIVLALLNDIPIISLAFDRVKVTTSPAKIKVTERFVLSSLYGLTGIAESLILFFILYNLLHVSWPILQTIFFLKLTVSGHMLIYVAHTKQRWYRFLPSKEVITATFITQIIASLLAFTGLLMPMHISLLWIAVVWLWSLLWMQVAEGMKILQASVMKEE